LGVRNSASTPLIDAIRATLRSRMLLLVIDNFEHVTDAAHVLTDLLMANPGLTILATSRSVLSVYGEHVYPVPPMSVPNLPEHGARTPQLTKAISSSEAVRLFVTRANAAGGRFTLTAANGADVTTICRLLDGLPLAIELAAARIGPLTPRMLAQRLRQRLPMLDEGPRNVPDRLRTMRNAIAWSHDLLTPDERAVFRRLSVYAGVWTVSDAEAVTVDDSPGSPEPGSMLDTISSLIDKSLLRQVETPSEIPLFGMLQTLREYGQEQLSLSGERETIEHRHAMHMLRIAERAEPELIGPDQVAWLGRLASMHPDFQLAFAWLLDHDDPERALRLASALWRFAYTRGHIREGREWIETALARTSGDTALRAAALNGAGVLANMEGNLDLTWTLHSDALAIAERIGDRRSIGRARIGLGDVDATRHRFEAALEQYAVAERIFRDLGDRRSIAATMTNRGNLSWTMNRLDEAADIHERAKALYAATGDQRGIAWSVTNVGRIAAQQHDYPRAIPNLTEALDHYEALGDRGGSAEALEGIAQIAIGLGDHERAAMLLAAADGLREAVEHPIAPIDRGPYTEMLTALRERLGDGFERQWEADRSLSAAEIKTLAREILEEQLIPAKTAPRPARRVNARTLIKDMGVTDREIEVLALVAAGKTDRDIGEELFISTRTVQSHVANLLTKLEVSTRSAAVARALRSGIIT
ncbi:MAG: tetratricopeptide repeat protein, partial [Chloroflexia bacterium]|nr:tetratricopeptide repeat protein [Chloroflexia bacterium]